MELELAIEHLPAHGRPEQLLLLLHGWAQSGSALAPLATALRSEFPQAAVLVPESPLAADAPRRGRMWYSIEGLREPALESAGESAGVSAGEWARRVAAAREPLQAWVQAQQQRLGVGPAATCLGGFSQGAVLALELATRQDGIAGRVLAFGGRYVQPPLQPPRQCTLHFFHGEADDVFPVAELRRQFELIGAAQGDATIDIAGGVGHELHPVLVQRALFRLRNHIPMRTWQAALGAIPVAPAGHDDADADAGQHRPH